MPHGDFNAAQRHEIDRAIRAAETTSRYEFSVFVGTTEPDHRDYAERLHAVMASPDRSVLIMVNPADRAIEIVTGKDVRRNLNDQQVGLATESMRSYFQVGDFVGGIVSALAMLGESARR